MLHETIFFRCKYLTNTSNPRNEATACTGNHHASLTSNTSGSVNRCKQEARSDVSLWRGGPRL